MYISHVCITEVKRKMHYIQISNTTPCNLKKFSWSFSVNRAGRLLPTNSPHLHPVKTR